MSVLYALAYSITLGALTYAVTRAIQRLHHRTQQPAQQAAWQQRHHRIPAADDNQPGQDTTALTECRRIAAAGTAHRKGGHHR